MLVLNRRKDERILLSNGVSILVADIDGTNVRLAIEAPAHVDIWREEICPEDAKPSLRDLPPEASHAWHTFLDAVAEMRHRQKEYFRTQSQSALRAAQAAEKRVDRMLESLTSPRLL